MRVSRRSARGAGPTGRAVVLALSVGVAALLGDAARVEAQHQNPLFNMTGDPSIISRQIRLALPSAVRGLELLTSGGDAAEVGEAVQSIGDSYRYLRPAQESKESLMRRSTIRDPLVELETQRMWQIRRHMLACMNGQHIVNQNEAVITNCAGHLVEGIRQLRVLVAVTP